MKRFISLLCVFVFISVSVWGISPYAYQEMQDWKQRQENSLVERLRNEIRAELKAELAGDLNQEIYDLVKNEVKKEIDLLLAQNTNLNTNPLAHNSETIRAVAKEYIQRTSTSLNEPRSIQQAARGIVREIFSAQTVETERLVSNAELDQYVAGYGVPAQLAIPGGGMKPPVLIGADFQLASKTPAVPNPPAATSSDNLEDTSAGDGRAKSVERTLQQRGSVLLGKGRIQIEPSITWAHFSSNRINIQGFSILPVLVVGDISTQKLKRDVFIQNNSIKYGLWNNLQAEVKVPLRYQHTRISDTDSTSPDATSTAGGIGDIEFGLSRQIGWEQGLMPDLIAAINVKAPTGRSPYNRAVGIGTGHWATSASLIAAKSSDPTVIFGSLTYTHNFEEDVENFGTIKPGDSIGYSFGTAIALSYQTAINFSFDHTVSMKLKRAGRRVPGSFVNSANFKTGLNWSINENSSIDVSVSFGITEDALMHL